MAVPNGLVYQKPSSFGHDPGINVYYMPSTGGFYTDFDKESYKVDNSNTIHYVDPVNGIETGDGTEDARSTISGLLSTLNDGETTDATIFLEPGYYDATQAFTETVPAFNANIICEEGIAIIEHAVSGTWTKTDGRTNVYQYNKSTGEGPNGAWDRTKTDSDGIPVAMSKQASTSAVDANPGSWYLDGTTLYVHTWDSRVPDSDVRVSLGFATPVSLGAYATYMENVHLMGGDTALDVDHNTNDITYTFVNCKFTHGLSGEGVQINTNRTTTYNFYRCHASYNGSDGFNYKRNTSSTNGPDVSEIFCKAIGNGRDSSTQPNNNGSTGHDGARIARFGGVYTGNYNRQVHDIDTCETWCVQCVAGSAVDQSDFNDSAAFMIGIEAGGDEATGWYDGCTIVGPVKGELVAHGGATANYRNMDGPVESGAGTLQTY